MKYIIVKTARGRRTPVDEGSLREMNRRLKQLKKSTMRGITGRGCKHYKATFEIEPKQEGE